MMETPANQLTPELVRMAITLGMLDEDLDRIVDTIRARRETLGSMKLAEISVGDRVAISDNVRPKLLAGEIVEVMKIDGDKVHCKFLGYPNSSKWRHGGTVVLAKTLIGNVYHTAGWKPTGDDLS